jgi:hypothetical protein
MSDDKASDDNGKGYTFRAILFAVGAFVFVLGVYVAGYFALGKDLGRWPAGVRFRVFPTPVLREAYRPLVLLEARIRGEPVQPSAATLKDWRSFDRK